MPTRKWRSEQLVNTSLPGIQHSSDVAALTGGGFVVVWQDGSIFDTTDVAIRAQRYDAAGNKVGGELTIATAAGFDFTWPAVTGLADGGFYVTLTQENSADNYIVGAVYNANGAFVRSQTVVFAFGEDNLSDVARLGTGSIVTWRDPEGNSSDVLYRIFDAAGNGGDVLLANTSTTGPQENSAAAASPDGNTIAIVWDSSPTAGASRITGRLFDAAGNEFASEFRIDTGLGASVHSPVVTWLSNGEFVVAWTEVNLLNRGGAQIKVRVFDGQTASVVPLTDSILVNSTTFSTQEVPQITALPTGGFVVVWQDFSETGGDGSRFAIRLQAFDASGAKIGGEFLVNTSTSGDQDRPSISALTDGRVVVTWTDESSGSHDIRMQIIDPRDGIVTGTGGADTLYGHDLVGDEISGFAGNDVLLGLKGDDALYGGEGGDRLRGGAGGDYLDGGAGADTADYGDSTARVVLNLATGAVSEGHAAGDELVSIESVTGSAFNDVLTGSNAANTLTGGLGADTLTGGLGKDTLVGGGGADRFVFTTVADSAVGAGRDLIQQWDVSDRLDLAAIDANATLGGNQDFTFRGIGSADRTVAHGEVKYYQFGGNTYVVGNATADTMADFQIEIAGLHTLTAGNFIGIL